MRLQALAVGAVLVLGAHGAVAWEFVAGEAGAGYNYFSYDASSYDENDFEGFGSFVVGGPSGFNVEVDGQGGVGRWSAPWGSDTFWFMGTTVNVYYANNDFAVGAYGGVNTCEGCSPANYYAGLEAVRFLQNVDIGGGVGWFSNWGDPDAATAWGSLTAYANPDTSLGVSVDWNGNADYNEYGVSLYGQHRFTGSNWGVWGRVWLGRQEGDGWSSGEKSAQVGFIYYFDPAGTTLRQHNRLVPWN